MAGKISQMQPAEKLTLDALFEVVVQVAGTFKNRQVSLQTIKRDLELSTGSAYEIAVKHGFEGTEEEWLATLVGKSAYDIAVDQGFPGTQTDWISALGALYSVTPDVKGHVLVAGDTVGEWTPLDVPVVRALERLGFVVNDAGELVIDEGELTIRS
jgi:hypothetical protein